MIIYPNLNYLHQFAVYDLLKEEIAKLCLTHIFNVLTNYI